MVGSPPAVLFAKIPKADRQTTRHLSGGRPSSSSWIAPTPKWQVRPGARARSRSPSRVALPGLRSLAPGRTLRRRAASPDLDTDAKRKRALADLERDKKASSTHASDDSRLATMAAWAKKWGLELFPPSVASFKAIAATLKAGAYKSAAVYLQVYRVAAERRGFDVSPLLARDLKDYKRSCLRGLGGPIRPRPLPLESLGELSGKREPWIENGPLNPRAAIIGGSWWLCREVELSSTRARLLELILPSTGPPSARWHLPASKTDTEAVGMARTLHCCCTAVGVAACPVHALWDHLCYLEHVFPARFAGGVPDWDLPLFPSSAGTVVTKRQMTQTIEEAAKQLGIHLAAPDGSERVSGHSLRVTGAQGLARMGWDLWAIQLHGRWQSDVVKHYVREAHLSTVGGGADLEDPLTLELVVRRVIQKLGGLPQVGSEGIPVKACPALPHADQLRHIIEAEQPTAYAEPDLSPGSLILHTGSGIYHRRQEQSSIRTACGWNFADSGVAVGVPDKSAGPHAWFQLCCRCWPRARASAKTVGGPLALCDHAT